MAGSVSDGRQYSSSLTYASFSWEGFTDPESKIQHYRLLIYHTPSNTLSPLLVHMEVLNEATMYSSNHFSFSNGDSITATVEAYNTAGLSVTGTSDGYIIDMTPPLLTYLVDGTDINTDLIYQSSTDTLSVSWSAHDSQSGLSMIEVAFYQIIEGQRRRIHPNPLLVDESTISLPITATNYTATGLELTNSIKYICLLTLTNGAGINTVYETNGVTIDSVRPVVSSVSVLGEAINGIVTTGSKKLRAEWAGSDEGSGIASYSVAVVTSDGSIVTPGGAYVEYEGIEGGLIEGLNLMAGNELTGPFYKVRVIANDHASLSSLPVDSMPFW